MSKQCNWPVFFLLFFFVIFFINPVYAQEGAISSYFDVNILPEYDASGSVLVTLSGIIQNTGTNDLKELNFTLPGSATIDKVAFVRETGELTYLPFNLESKDNSALFKISLNPILKPQSQLNLFIQLHFGSLPTGEKKIDTLLKFPFTAKKLNVKVLEPQGAGMFKTTLKNDLVTQTHEGLKLHNYTLENTNTLALTFSYNRNDTTPVAPKEDYQSALNRLQEQAKTQQNTSTNNTSTNSSIIIGIIIILAVLVVGVTITFYFVNSQKQTPKEEINKKVLKKMFVEGKITEEEYRKLLKKALEQEG